MSLIKSPQDLSNIRIAGQKLSQVLATAAREARVGMSLLELDAIIAKEIKDLGTTPSFLGFEGFPNSSCLSLNEQVVHGIPDERLIQGGDILGIDIGLWYNKVCVDAAVTVGIGNISDEAERLLRVTYAALKAGVKAAKPFNRVGSISSTVQAFADSEDLGIVRALTGHGVGHHVHEAPDVPNFGRVGDGALLKPGMVIAIEPMFNLGTGSVETQVDGWGIITSDGSLSAQFEHTVIIGNKGPESVIVLPPYRQGN